MILIMSHLKNFRILLSCFCALLITGCITSPPSEVVSEALKNANRGAIGMIQSDYKMYKIASKSKLNPMTEALLYSTIEKVAVIRGYEQSIGSNYSVDDGLNIMEINQICWMGNFLQEYKQYIPPEMDKNTIYAWIELKQKKWKDKLNKVYGNEIIKDDCRSIDS